MKLALLGDIALFGNMSISNNKNWKEYYLEVADILSEMDFVVGNLESPFSIKKKTMGAKSAYICSDVDNVNVLKYLHVNAVTLANNHIFDYGQEGYETTKRILQENDIKWFGAEGKALKIEINDNRLVFEGFCCYSSNPLNCVAYGEYGINEFNVGLTQSILKQHIKDGHLPILAIHAGIEHVNYPSIDTISVARKLGDEGPYIYYGHHPHVLQGIEKYGESLIAYSLGNFCFDDVYSSASRQPLIRLSENNRTSCILVVQIEDNRITSHEIIPVYIGKDRLRIFMGSAIKDMAEYLQTMSSMNEIDYKAMRNSIIAEYISGRKQKRNLMWYLKRMRPRYYLILKNAKRNKQNYNRCVEQYLNK